MKLFFPCKEENTIQINNAFIDVLRLKITASPTPPPKQYNKKILSATVALTMYFINNTESIGQPKLRYCRETISRSSRPRWDVICDRRANNRIRSINKPFDRVMCQLIYPFGYSVGTIQGLSHCCGFTTFLATTKCKILSVRFFFQRREVGSMT